MLSFHSQNRPKTHFWGPNCSLRNIILELKLITIKCWLCALRHPLLSSLLLSFCGWDLPLKVTTYSFLTSQTANRKPAPLSHVLVTAHNPIPSPLLLIFKGCSLPTWAHTSTHLTHTLETQKDALISLHTLTATCEFNYFWYIEENITDLLRSSWNFKLLSGSSSGFFIFKCRKKSILSPSGKNLYFLLLIYVKLMGAVSLKVANCTEIIMASP